MNKKFLLIDGYGFLFRAYHSLPPLRRDDGIPVGAIYGFTSMLLKLLTEHEYTHIAIVLDSGKKSFRNQIYPQYKSNRPPPPEDLVPQFALLREAITALNITSLEMENYEADDLIATYAKLAIQEQYQVTIISSDKDLMQLVNDDNIIMFDAMKNRVINQAFIQEKFGVPADMLLDLLALSGDSSDNIPGIPGIGPKTSAELLTNFKTLENLLKNTHLIKQNKRRENIENNKELALLSKKLLTLKYDVPINIPIDQLIHRDFNYEKLINFLNKQNFKSLAARFIKKNINNTINTDLEIKYISTTKELKNLLDELELNDNIALQLLLNNKITLVIYVEEASNIYAIEIKSIDKDLFTLANKEIDFFAIKNLINKLFFNQNKLIITHDLKKILHYFDITINTTFQDVGLMSYIAENNMASYEIIALCNKHLGTIFTNSENDIIKSTGYFFKLSEIYHKLLFKNKMLNLYYSIEKPLINILYSMEREGIKIDKNKLNNLTHDFTEEMQKTAQEIFKIAGEEFNLSSPKQLAEILYDKLAIDLEKTINKKTRSTSAEILEELSVAGYDIVDLILKWRHYSKLVNTYTATLPKLVDKNDRIHTTFKMWSTTTGRLSSIEPNIQNIPIKSEEGKKIRNCFIAKEGYKFLIADYSQMELRILAAIADVKKLKNALNNNLDVHKITASEIFSVDPEEVTSFQRGQAKIVNYGIIYGISAYGLATRLKIPQQTAKDYINNYFLKFPEIYDYMEKTKNLAKKLGYVETIFGRRCNLPNINSSNHNLRTLSERAAINAPIQGTQADIIKIAMNEINKNIKNYDAKMLIQIHDELVFEVTPSCQEEFCNKIKNIMQNIGNFDVPIIVNIEISNSWEKI